MVRAIMAPELRTKPTNANMALLHDEWTAHRGGGCWQTAGDEQGLNRRKGCASGGRRSVCKKCGRRSSPEQPRARAFGALYCV